MRLELIGEGRNRKVFLLPSGKYVLKVPKNTDGEFDNFAEARRFANRNQNDYYPLARCRIIPGTHLLVMEFVNTCVPGKNRPVWTNYVDCGQVGYTKRGELVAYDYGN